ncbi:DoxX family protein [Paenibacillus cremeus]|uniref:DoxX family protein n=1 Tax=Paenibacillus cremeus TaxID=2163881 RepID=A0A559K8G8_9BACL|nr:DoxX family protein [Paenibacillus cremeus]TVY08419.1 DoxX family protein [Paenibacillus cremeus]
MMDYGLLLIRLIIGLTFMGHGAQKLFGWFGGYGIKGTGQWLDSIGMKPGALMALVAGLSELLGGFFFASGWLTVIGAVLIVLTMLMAIVKVHAKNGFWVTAGGMEYNVVLIAAAIGVALIGPGALALGA